jgi:hypothetical protein
MEAHQFWSANHGESQAAHNLLLEHWHLEAAPSVQQVTNLLSVLSALEALGSSMVEPSAMTTPLSQHHNLSGLLINPPINTGNIGLPLPASLESGTHSKHHSFSCHH